MVLVGAHCLILSDIALVIIGIILLVIARRMKPEQALKE
jgi:hypothetical protein